MKTKEEILKKHILLGQSELDITKDNEFEGEDYKITEKYLCNAMQEYAMQFQEDMTGKKYTEEDMLKCWNTAFIDAMNIDSETYEPIIYSDFINSLNKQD